MPGRLEPCFYSLYSLPIIFCNFVGLIELTHWNKAFFLRFLFPAKHPYLLKKGVQVAATVKNSFEGYNFLHE